MLSVLTELKWLILIAVLQQMANFEVQRWWRARQAGVRGASEVAGAFIDLSFLIPSVLYVVWLIFAAFRIGVIDAILIWTSQQLISILLHRFTGADALWKWSAGLVSVWPLTIAMWWLLLTST